MLDKIEVRKDHYDKRQWVRLVNSLSGFKSVNLLGTIDQKGHTNLSVISSCFHLGASPPLLGFVLRPHSKDSPRHSLVNIQKTQTYTLNHVTEAIYKKAHQTSARYRVEQSEFQKVGLVPEFKKDFTAPFVRESPLQMGLKLLELVDIKQNGTTLVVGEIEKIYLPQGSLMKDGFVDLEGLGSLCVSSLDSYHSTKRINRLSYAKPDKAVMELRLNGDLKD